MVSLHLKNVWHGGADQHSSWHSHKWARGLHFQEMVNSFAPLLIPTNEGRISIPYLSLTDPYPPPLPFFPLSVFRPLPPLLLIRSGPLSIHPLPPINPEHLHFYWPYANLYVGDLPYPRDPTCFFIVHTHNGVQGDSYYSITRYMVYANDVTSMDY